MTQAPRDRTQRFLERGYCVIPAFLEPAERAELRHTCDIVLERVRAESTTKVHSTPSISRALKCQGQLVSFCKPATPASFIAIDCSSIF